MTRVQFYRKLKPLFKAKYAYYRKHGAAAVRDAFIIAWLEEFEYRMTADADDASDDVPFFDEVDPKWFFDSLVDEAANGATADHIFVPEYDMAFEYYTETIEGLEDFWHDTHDTHDTHNKNNQPHEENK